MASGTLFSIIPALFQLPNCQLPARRSISDIFEAAPISHLIHGNSPLPIHGPPGIAAPTPSEQRALYWKVLYIYWGWVSKKIFRLSPDSIRQGGASKLLWQNQ
jgi:hypothetical protein